MKKINIKGIQLHTYRADGNSEKINQIYAEYANTLHDVLSDYLQEIRYLKNESDSKPAWLRETRVCTLCVLQELEIKHLEMISHHLLARPQRLLDSLESIDDTPIVTQHYSSTEIAVRDLWLKIVDLVEEISKDDTPIVVWHLEQNYLTIFTTGLKHAQNAATSIN